MTGRTMDGQVVARQIRSSIKDRVKVVGSTSVQPHLVTILVGDNPASKAYLKNIHAACSDVGMSSRNQELPTGISQEELLGTIHALNGDKTVTGILLQLPLPKGLDEGAVVSSIAPQKDVDGLHPYNLGLLMEKAGVLVPCTPKGVMVLLRSYGVNVVGKNAVIINRSKLVGRPLSQLLLNQDATVTVCHSKTGALSEISRQADILITGIGHRSEFVVGPDMIKPGAVVVDVGTSSVQGKLMGDVDFESAIQVAAYVSPVPGGVGPMTIAMMLYNTLLSACLQKKVEMGIDLNELRQSFAK